MIMTGIAHREVVEVFFKKIKAHAVTMEDKANFPSNKLKLLMQEIVIDFIGLVIMIERALFAEVQNGYP